MKPFFRAISFRFLKGAEKQTSPKKAAGVSEASAAKVQNKVEHKHTSNSEKSHKQNKKFIRCLLDVRKIPLEKFRLPRDGKKRLRAARSRYNFLCTLAQDANADGTFQRFDRKAGKINFSPRVKKLLRHMAERTVYRMTTDLRELGFLSWRREKKHYGSRIFRIHFSPRQRASDSEKKHLPDTARKQQPASEKHLPTRHVLLRKTPAYKACVNTCQINGKTQESTAFNPVKSVPDPPLESFPPVGSVTGGSRTAAASCTNTPPKKDASATLRAFLAFGFDAPFGHPRFQEAVLRNSAEIKNGNQLEVMENVIVELDGKVPPLWYAAKHALEETLQSAAVRSEAQVGSPRQSRAAEPFSRNEIEAYCARNAAKLERAADKFPAIAERLREIAKTLNDRWAAVCRAEHIDLESVEREFIVLEENIFALVKKEASDEQISEIHREMERSLKRHRAKMSREQMSELENQYLRKRLLEEFGIPRLSLYFLT